LSFAIALISVSFSLLLSSWLPWLPILPSIFHGSCNGHLLQLSECIELLKCEVKKKMNDEGGRSRGTKVTEALSATKKLRDVENFSVCMFEGSKNSFTTEAQSHREKRLELLTW
jgi:hypothetical protein